MSVLPPAELFAEIWRRHGHRCPMSTLGGRLGWAARRQFPAATPAGALHAVYRIDTCAVEGIRCATGCGEVAGTLELRPEGSHRLTLVERGSGRGVDAAIRPATLLLAGEYRQLDDALERERGSLEPAELARRLRAKEAFLDALLERFCTLPEEELLELRIVAAERE
jgi:formylmethanofuran dehydrogenase subunit E